MPVVWFGIIIFLIANGIAVKRKNPKITLAAIACLALFMIMAAPLRTVLDNGNSITIENKIGGSATLERTSGFSPKVYALVGNVTRPWGFSGYYNVKIPVLPVGLVDELNAKYGDFRKCEFPGTSGILNNLIELRLIGVDKKKINEIETAFEKSQRDSENVFLHVDGESLRLVENKMQGRGGDASAAQKQEDILVKEINIFAKK